MKQLKLFDYIIIAAVIAVLIIGVLVYFGKNKFSKSPVEATKKIAFQVMLKSVSLTDTRSPFQIGEESFITIRNVPYTKLKIIDVAYQPKKMVLPLNNASQPYAVIDDYSQPNQYDFVISLIDEAKITKDGPVVGGNKIKIGLPIVLEGFNYRIGGTISNVQILENKDLPLINQYVEQHRANKSTNTQSVESDKEKDINQDKADSAADTTVNTKDTDKKSSK